MLIDRILSYQAEWSLPCKKVTLVGHELGSLEAMHVANLPDMDKKVDKVINLSSCAFPSLDWAGLPTPPAARRLSAEPAQPAKGGRELFSAADWPDYKTAKREAKSLLPEDKYDEFYNCVRTESLADKAAWTADWQSIFDDCWDDYKEFSICPPPAGYTPDPDLLEFWDEYIGAFEDAGPSVYGPGWEDSSSATDQKRQVCTALAAGDAAAEAACLTEFEGGCYATNSPLANRIKFLEADAWPNCKPEIHLSVVKEALLLAWYQ